MRAVLSSVAIAIALVLGSAGCFGTPTPLDPAIQGSVGVPHHGVITNAARLPNKGTGFARLKSNDARWGNPRLVALVEAAAAEVARERPGGAPLMIGDLSPRWGGASSGHHSHRTGRDADLLIFVTTLDGRPVRSPGFLRFGPDGLAETDDHHYVRIDLEREWALVKALVTSREASVQWLFFAHWLEALVIEYARARGEDPELLWHAESVLLQPGDSAAHDDHLHLRIACSPDEAVAGCLGGGPYWSWIPELPQLVSPPDDELAEAILGDAGEPRQVRR
ncbi:MAG TPA: penicillin-insensitive murein endopeptidase [Minicystis sp.]|nr:penicillin-insensitive murein endopeptidase [Minicystis sp.]